MHVSEQREKPLWLELRHERRTYVFEFAADDERAVVVGSLADADVQLKHNGPAPLCFHFERERDAVLIVPGYSADVRVNATRLSSSAPVPSRALIEFSNVHLEAQVFRKAPQTLDSEPDTRTSSTRQASTRVRSVADEFQPTRAIQALPVTDAVTTTSAISLAAPRLVGPPSALDVGRSEDLPCALLEDSCLLDQATEVMVFMPFELETFEVPATSGGSAIAEASPLLSAQATKPMGSLVRSFEEITPNVVIRPVGQIALTEPRPARPVSVKDARAGSVTAGAARRQQTTELAFVKTGAGYRERPENEVAGEPPEIATWRRARLTWFEKLGLLAKRRPVLVGVAAVECGLLIALGLRLLTTFALGK